MNYHDLVKLAEELNKEYGKPKQYGFIIAPKNMEQRNLLMEQIQVEDKIVNYVPKSQDEQLVILAVTRTIIFFEEELRWAYECSKIDGMGIRHLAASNSEISRLLDEYFAYRIGQ